MADTNKVKEQEIDATITEDIDPVDVVIDDDTEMPKPKTKNYDQVLIYNDKFMNLFYGAVNDMKYSTVLKDSNNNNIKLVDLVNFVEKKKATGIAPSEMNNIISFMANADFKYVRSFMQVIEDKEKQKELWIIK